MVEILHGERPFLVTREGVTDVALLDAIYEVEGFHLRAYSEHEIYFDEPEPYLELDISSAAVIARILNSNSILLVEFVVEDRGRRVELPAGKVMDGVDKTIFDTASREFIEETGGIITLPKLRPFAVSYHKDGRGGLQFYTEIPELRVEGYDKLGRGYLAPPKGTDKGKIINLITEPLGVFLDQEKTLLRHSQNQWAVDEVVRLTLGMHITKLDGDRK
jgi:8-oxo-dGTP pyrophosphatase MutT (NUDIX family)